MLITIARASETDSFQVKKMIFNIWENEYGFNVSDQQISDLDSLEESYPISKSCFLVAKNVDEIVGTIAFDRLGGNEYVLKRMFVKKDYRRRGIAQKLINHLFEEIRVFAVHPSVIVYLSTKSDLAQAAKVFYLRNGFEVIQKSELPSGFPFFYEDDLFMKKILTTN